MANQNKSMARSIRGPDLIGVLTEMWQWKFRAFKIFGLPVAVDS